MKILVIGSGGREHALCWALKKSPLISKLYCAPGNGGIEEVADCIPITAEDMPSIIDFCNQESIDFVVVGPEGPLVMGLVDALMTRVSRVSALARLPPSLKAPKAL